MKRIAFTILLAMIFVSVSAQTTVTTSWPYLYDDFLESTIYMKGGQKLVQKVNINVVHDKAHYLDKDVVKELVLTDVLIIEIGADRYMNVNNEMMKVVAENGDGFVAAEITGDFAALRETGGAYGTSSATAATRKVASLDLDSQINQNHVLLLQSKHDGSMLNLVTRYFIVSPAFVCAATRKDVDSMVPADRQDEWKKWQKEKKIKWKEPQSLLDVLKFFTL